MALWRAEFHDAVRAVVDPTAAPSRRAEAQAKLEGWRRQDDTLDLVATFLEDAHHGRIPSSESFSEAYFMAAVLVKQVLRRRWTGAIDEFKRSKDDIQFLGWLRKVEEVTSLCGSIVLAGTICTEGAFVQTLQQVVGESIKRGLATVHLDPDSQGFAMQATSGFSMQLEQIVLLGTRDSAAGNATQRSRCLNMISAILGHINSADHLSLIGLNSRTHLLVRRRIESGILPEVAKHCMLELQKSTQDDCYLRATLDLLNTTLNWSFRMSAFATSNEIGSGFLTPPELLPMFVIQDDQVPEHFTASPIFENVLQVDTVLTNSIGPNDDPGIASRLVLHRLAAVRLSHLTSLFSSGRSMPRPVQRRAKLTQTIFLPFIGRIFSKSNAMYDVLEKSLLVQTSPSHEHLKTTDRVLKAAISYFDIILVLIYNSDCGLDGVICDAKEVAFKQAILNLLVRSLNIIKASSKFASLADTVLELTETTIKAFSYLLYLIDQTCSDQERLEYEHVLAPSLTSFLIAAWPLLDADSAEDLEEIRGITGGDEEITLSTGSGEVSKRARLDLPDDRYIARIGLLSQICRMVPFQCLHSLGHEFLRVIQSGDIHKTAGLDYARFFFLMSSTILTCEPRSCVQSSTITSSRVYFYRDSSSLDHADGSIPWSLVKRPEAFSGESMSQYFTLVFGTAANQLNVLSPERLNQFSPTVVQALLVFLMRVLHAYAFHPPLAETDLQRPGQRPYAFLSNPENSIRFLDTTIGFFLSCLRAMPNEPEVARIAVLGLRSFVMLDRPSQPAVWTCRTFVDEALGALTEPNKPILYNLPAQDRAKFLAFVASASLPSESTIQLAEAALASSNSDELARIQDQCTSRENHLLRLAKPLVVFTEMHLSLQEWQWRLTCIHGILRGYSGLLDAPEDSVGFAIASLSRLVRTLFGSDQSAGGPSTPLVIDASWIRRLGDPTIPESFEVYAEICAILKLVFVICKTLPKLEVEDLTNLCAPLCQVSLIQADLWKKTAKDTDSDERKFATVPACIAKIGLTLSLQRRGEIAAALVRDSVLPLVRNVVETDASMLLEEDGKSEKFFDHILNATEFLLTTQPQVALVTLSVPEFATNAVRLVAEACNRSLSVRFAAEDFMIGLALALISKADYLLANRTDLAEWLQDPGVGTHCIEVWKWPLGELLRHMLSTSLQDRFVNSRHLTCAHLVCMVLAVLATDTNLVNQIYNERLKDISQDEATFRKHFEKFFEFARGIVEKTASSLKEGREAKSINFKLRLQEEFAQDLFHSFIIDCRNIGAE